MKKQKHAAKCRMCGKSFLTASPNAKYCTECGKEKDREAARIAYADKKWQSQFDSLKMNNINKFLKEKSDYEKRNGTYISYGKYMDLRTRRGGR